MVFKISTPIYFFVAVARTAWAKLCGYRILTTDSEQLDRLDECADCDQLTAGRQCRVCTCDVDAKTSLTMEQCPKRKWLRIYKLTKPRENGTLM